ncbi:MAG: aromatic amino acid beta-eliminating lyase/threonine aldolase [Pseudonocardiales bacterium]|nr:aromatic amino acid beta-eliminating lyase/threonine aldolase [Pseudonocardiales bacterium]
MMDDVDIETRRRRDSCTRFLLGNGFTRPDEHLAALPADIAPDVYGDGGVVEELERHVADLLGKPAAVYLPSGTMAQGATLRVHADALKRRTVLWHPKCHLEQHELRAYSVLHDLVGRPVGTDDSLITLADLEKVAEPFGALVIELPQRDLGGAQPSWDELCEQVAWAHGRGAVAHLDGARLWESAAGYSRSPAEIAALFDTVYVSFYKGIGALAGCCVGGSAEVVAQVREWRQRLGGTLHDLWPGAASALVRISPALTEMPERLVHAQAIAAALGSIDGVTVLPDPPQTPMMHLLFRVDAARFVENARSMAEQEGIWVWPQASMTADPSVVRCELSVGRATCSFGVDEVAGIVRRLLA